MTTEATKALVESTGLITDKILQYMTATEELLVTYGGDAADLGLNVLRIEAGYNLILALAGMILAGVITWLSYTTPKRLGLEKDWPDHPVILVKVIGSIGGVIGVITNGANFINIWNWVGLFWPEAYAVHKFILN